MRTDKIMALVDKENLTQAEHGKLASVILNETTLSLEVWETFWEGLDSGIQEEITARILNIGDDG